jgi:DNA recombination protein RmuC
MSVWIISVAVGVVTLAVLWVITGSLRRSSEAQARAIQQEMQATLTAQAQTLTAQVGQLTQQVTQQLGQVSQQLQTGMAATGSLASQAQKAVSDELKASQETLGRIQRELGTIQQFGRDLTQATRTIQQVLGGAQTRGALGEVALDRLLSDALPQAAYATQHRFSTGEAVDAVVFLRDKLLPIDSKFPLDDFRRIAELGEEARRGFAVAVKSHADAIAKKYILPDEGTLNLALMFVPSENVYYELLMTTDAKGTPLDAYCRSKGIVAVSPNTLYAHLNVILLGLRGMQIEENARNLLASLAGLKKQFDTFSDVFEKLGTHLRNAQQSHTDADRRLERARTALEQMAEGALPEAAQKALEAGAKD